MAPLTFPERSDKLLGRVGIPRSSLEVTLQRSSAGALQTIAVGVVGVEGKGGGGDGITLSNVAALSTDGMGKYFPLFSCPFIDIISVSSPDSLKIPSDSRPLLLYSSRRKKANTAGT